jgi:hypothetical protein
MGASCVFVRDLSRFVQKFHSPIFGTIQRCYVWWPFTPRIDKIELNPSFAFAITFATVLTMRPGFIALQVPFTAGETSCPHTFWLAALTTILAIASVHQISLGIRFGSDSFDFLVRFGARMMRRSLALVWFQGFRF